MSCPAILTVELEVDLPDPCTSGLCVGRQVQTADGTLWILVPDPDGPCGRSWRTLGETSGNELDLSTAVFDGEPIVVQMGPPRIGVPGEIWRTVDAREFGAKGDRSQDDAAAIQEAIDVAFAEAIGPPSDVAGRARVILPPGAYVTSRPLFTHNVALFGTTWPQYTTIEMAFDGPAVVATYGDGNIPTVPALVGTGVAWACPDIDFFNIPRFILSDSRAMRQFDGLTGLCLQFWFRHDGPTGSYNAFLASGGRRSPGETYTTAFSVIRVDVGYLRFMITAGGTVYSVDAPFVLFPIGTTRHVVIDYDDARGDVVIYIDGVKQVTAGAAVVTGAIDQEWWEDVCLGAQSAYIGSNPIGASTGFTIDSLRISNASLIGPVPPPTIPVPTVKYTVDPLRTMMLINWEEQDEIVSRNVSVVGAVPHVCWLTYYGTGSYGGGIEVARLGFVGADGGTSGTGVLAVRAPFMNVHDIYVVALLDGVRYFDFCFESEIARVNGAVQRWFIAIQRLSGITSVEDSFCFDSEIGFLVSDPQFTVVLKNCSSTSRRGGVHAVGTYGTVLVHGYGLDNETYTPADVVGFAAPVFIGGIGATIQYCTLLCYSGFFLTIPGRPAIAVSAQDDAVDRTVVKVEGCGLLADPTVGAIGIENMPFRVAVTADRVDVFNNAALTNHPECVEVVGSRSYNVPFEYKIGGQRIVGPRRPAIADATGAGDVVAQLNLLLAACRDHGLIEGPVPQPIWEADFAALPTAPLAEDDLPAGLRYRMVGPGANTNGVGLMLVNSSGIPPTGGLGLIQPALDDTADAGRLQLEFVLVPDTARAGYAYDPMVWTYDLFNFCNFDRTTGALRVALNLDIGDPIYVTPTTLTWAAGDTVELWVACGGGVLATVVKARVNGGGVVTLSSGVPPVQGRLRTWQSLDLLCRSLARAGGDGTPTDVFTGEVGSVRAYETGHQPAWV